MKVRLHPHAIQRLSERGAREPEVVETVLKGEKFPAKFGRTGFRLNFDFNNEWREKMYNVKQIEALAVLENDIWLVITVILSIFKMR